ncbi:MAG: hypothetical protein ABW098_05500 [Candidatus Thiodiazotropha sp.]
MNSKEISIIKIISWIGLEVGIPILFVFALWPISLYILELEYAFERTLSSADLIPLGAMILIGAGVNTTFDEIAREKRSIKIIINIIGVLFFSLFFLFIYGFVKSVYLTYSFPIPPNLVETKITYFAYLSIACIVFSITYSFALRAMSFYTNIMKR